MIKFKQLFSSLKNWQLPSLRASSYKDIRLRKNRWLSPKTWGSPMVAIDFSGIKTLLKDDRIHIVYKQQHPTLCEEYVLWRVEHDGSCWVSTGITQLIYQMIEAGPEKFDEVVDYFKMLFASDQESNQKENQDVARNLFSILELIRKKMDHNFSLTIRNHRNVYKAFECGFRKILSLYWRKYDDLKSSRINTAFSLGYAADFKELFNEIGFKYAEFLTDGECDGAPATMSYFDLGAYLTDQELGLLSPGNEIAQQSGLYKKMPPIMAFLSTPGFMDVAVKKDLSNQINAKTVAFYTERKFERIHKVISFFDTAYNH